MGHRENMIIKKRPGHRLELEMKALLKTIQTWYLTNEWRLQDDKRHTTLNVWKGWLW